MKHTTSIWGQTLWEDRTLPFTDEKRRMLGYWFGFGEPDSLPDPQHLVDADWDPAIRARIVRYLKRRSFKLPYAAAGLSKCRICGDFNGGTESSDGTYVWPSGLAHYVEDHDVRLPDDFVAHVAAQSQRKKR